MTQGTGKEIDKPKRKAVAVVGSKFQWDYLSLLEAFTDIFVFEICILEQDVVNYMRDNGFKVDGKTIDQYLKENGNHLDQGKLKAVKASLETVSNRASDFVSQSQLQLQKLMQTYNVTVSLLNSMQTMLAEMNKSIAQNIR